MATRTPLSNPQKVVAGALLVATVGVIFQILGGAPYSGIPPVFFIQLIPAALLVFGRWRWTAILSLLAGAFLTLGLFTSGAYKRLTAAPDVLDTIGIWIQFIAILVTVAWSAVILASPRSRTIHS